MAATWSRAKGSCRPFFLGGDHRDGWYRGGMGCGALAVWEWVCVAWRVRGCGCGMCGGGRRAHHHQISWRTRSPRGNNAHCVGKCPRQIYARGGASMPRDVVAVGRSGRMSKGVGVSGHRVEMEGASLAPGAGHHWGGGGGHCRVFSSPKPRLRTHRRCKERKEPGGVLERRSFLVVKAKAKAKENSWHIVSSIAFCSGRPWARRSRFYFNCTPGLVVYIK